MVVETPRSLGVESKLFAAKLGDLAAKPESQLDWHQVARLLKSRKQFDFGEPERPSNRSGFASIQKCSENKIY